MDGHGYFTSLMNEGNNNYPLDDLSSPPEEQPSPVVESTPSARPNQKRSKNFSEKEDTMLVSAWLNISTDPIHGTNQTRGTFWK
uniref:Myb-like domain-containing protein n=1 Tax=Arundo donax TaxID=35708 RepID=A0A0A9GFG5_ARUDO